MKPLNILSGFRSVYKYAVLFRDVNFEQKLVLPVYLDSLQSLMIKKLQKELQVLAFLLQKAKLGSQKWNSVHESLPPRAFGTPV
ncbi:hypothetical protein L1987_63724 [Smallanthus sonchifolius]|uniref:Uncharacterized protein n=1 Tax=Smallanthus sonchifolius TaxID=185202 RepID=A0ACB9CE20_9ASTR|nr:hypothetical protein L1987_63724 [Smallanthus sonchifolius]